LLQTKKNKKQIATKPKGKATTSMWGSTFHSTENYPLSNKKESVKKKENVPGLQLKSCCCHHFSYYGLLLILWGKGL